MRLPPPVLALAAAAAQRALTPGASPPSAARRVLAGATVAASVATMGSAMRVFRSSGTTVDPVHPDRATSLVTSGPFRITRNPMYVGLTGLLTAHTLLRGSTLALAPQAAFFLLIDRLQVPAEEAAMAGKFGADYDSYRSRVPRWIGV
jgi:protein-S-isoprenylcysteine O-methyltransferase Ste14